jgi:hypothetical protein
MIFFGRVPLRTLKELKKGAIDEILGVTAGLSWCGETVLAQRRTRFWLLCGRKGK